VQVLGQVTQPDPQSWRIDLEIQNRGGEVEQGFVWAVATIRTSDGRLVRVPSDRKIDVKHPAKHANGEHGPAIGTPAYGAIYVISPDIVVHRRVRIRNVPQWTYLRRIIMAHLVHHKTHGKEGAQSFGFLWAPKDLTK